MADIFTLESSAVPDGGRVVGFRGHEALSQLFRFSIGVLLKGHQEIDIAGARGLRAGLTIQREVGAPLELNGMIASASLRHAWLDQALYELVVVPKVWALTLTHFSRVWVEMSVPDIIEEVLGDSGLSADDYQLKLDGSYDPQLHVCQYKESRWNFIARLMEREGMYFFFEHADGASKLIITDSLGFHGELRQQPVRYIPLTSGDNAISGEALSHFTADHHALPKNVKTRDFDYLKPTLDVKGEASVWDDSAAERVIYGDNFITPERGAAIATVRAEAWLAAELVYRGAGHVFGLRSGYRFVLDEHPVASLNREYLCVELEHQGNQAVESEVAAQLLGLSPETGYHVSVCAMAADVQYRPQRRTPVPRINGLERGFVDGPVDSEYAQIDEHGRYKIKLHFDIDDSDHWDGTASTWIRMLQPHAGGTEGFHFPLRRNTEVLVAFLGGEPDRPVIVGAVPDAVHPSPVTKDNHTQNVIQTGSENRIEIEDQKPDQYIDISTPPQDTRIHLGKPHGAHSHYIVFHTDGDQLVDIGGTRDIEVGGDQNEHVAGDVTENYDNDHDTTVGGDQTLTVGCDRDVTVGGDQTFKIACDFDVTVGGDHVVDVSADNDFKVGGDQTFKVGGDRDVKVSGDQTFKVGGDFDVNAAGDITHTSGGDFAVNASGDVSLWTAGNYTAAINGNRTVTVSGSNAVNVLSDLKWSICSHTITAKFANETELVAGLKMGAFVGVKVELEASLSLKVVGGVKAEFDSAVNLRKSPVEVVDAPAWVRNGAVTVFKSGIYLIL